jgi:hypothetical protein
MQCGAKSVKLVAAAFGDEFHAAIGQIADGAGDFKTGGDGFGGVTKAHALHPAGEKHGQPAAGSGGYRLRHAQDKAKGGAAMQLFSAARAICFDFSLTPAAICPNQLPVHHEF